MVKLTKIWITKWALSGRIYVRNAEILGGEALLHRYANKMVDGSDAPYIASVIKAGEWQETKELALDECLKMRAKKLASLSKSINKIESIDFKKLFKE